MTVFRSCARRIAQVVASYQVAAISALVVAILVGTLSTDITASISRRIFISQTDCGTEPNWPDCAEKSCSSGSWTCTRMNEGSSSSHSEGSYSSYGEYNSSSYSSYGQYNSAGSAGSYNSNMPCQGSPPNSDYSNYWCNYNTGAWEKSSGGGSSTSWSGGGCSWPSPSGGNWWCDYSTSPPTWKESSGGGSCAGTPPPNSWCEGGVWKSSGGGGWGEAAPEVQSACRSRCEATGKYSAADCQMYCRDGDFEGPGGGGGGCTGTPPPNSWCEGGVWKTSGGGGGPGGGSSMQRCFYTDAKINGKHPGFTVWCERDYQNCHVGEPSGKPVSTEGLQLGAPSQCESGWGGGAGYGSDGGFSGGGDINCCLPTPECKPGTPCPSYMPKCIMVKPGQNPPEGYSCGGSSGGYGGAGYGGDSYGGYGDFGGIGDYMGDLGGAGGHSGPGDDEQLAREKKDMVRNMSQKAREVKDMRRQLKDSRSGDPTLTSQIDAFENSIAGVTQCFESATDFDMMRDCYDRNNDLNDLTQGIWAKLQAGNIVQNLKNDERELKDMTREIARLEREDRDTGQLNSILEEIRSIQEEVRSLLESDPEEAQYRMQDLGDLKREFWDAMQEVNRGEQEMHMKKFLKDGCRDFEREAKRAPKNLRQEVDALVDECGEIIAQAESDLESGAEPWEVEENMRAIQDLWPRFQEIMESQWGEQDCRGAERGLAEAGRAIQSEAPRIIDQIRDTHPAIADQMETLLEKAEAILEEGEDALAGDNCEQAIDIVDTLHYDVSQRFDDLMRKAGMDVDDFEGGYDNEYDEFYTEFEFDDFDADEFNGYLTDNEYDLGTLSLAKRIAGNIIAQYLKGQKDSGAPDLISTAADLGIPALELQKLLEVKNSLLAEIDALRASVQSLKGELASIADKLAQFTFGEETGEEAEKFLTEELQFLTPEEAEVRFAELQDDARREFVENGTAPYLDVQPFEGHGWFADAVANMTDAGLFTGVGDGEFAPEKEANVAEVVTTFARALEVDESGAEPVSDLAGDMPQWAEEPAAGLEEVLADQGEDLSSVFEGSPGDAVTRLEVARLISAVYSDAFDETSGTEVLGGYTDLSGLSPDDLDAIAFVVEAEIMTGTEHEWNPDEGFNRAQFATVMDRLAEATGEFGHEEDGYDYEEEDTEGSDFGGGLAPEDEGSAYQSDEEEEEHSAAEESVASEEAQAPAYYYDSEITQAQLSEIQEGIAWYQSQHKTKSEYTSTIRNIADLLILMKKEFEPFAQVKTWKLNVCNEFVGKETEVLRMIMSELGRPINC